MAVPLGAEFNRTGWMRRAFARTKQRPSAKSSPQTPTPVQPTDPDRVKSTRWVGASTWFVPSTEAQDVTGLSNGLQVNELTTAELRAAVELRFVAPASISNELWQKVLAVAEEDIPAGARSLLKKTRLRSARHHLMTPTEPITLPIATSEQHDSA